MVETGWFNGRTFHRVAPNFVVQGGSPGANEYLGDGPFTRDELGLASHVRGTVGISTRGRDTGDGQIFVNLIDNWRLDHDYTIIAEVVSGMEVVDRMLEGAVIRRAEVTER
jgi:cyclophilin family peptidyl-prolyl cis-trans isomerase